MNLAGMVAILAGWLMIVPAGAKTRGRRNYVLALLGAFVLTAGMATVIQARI